MQFQKVSKSSPFFSINSFFLEDKAIDIKSLNWTKISNNNFLNLGSFISLGMLYDIK